MRSHVRTAAVLLVAAVLVALFLRGVDLRRVGADIVRAEPAWLAVGLVLTFVNLAIRSYRWRYLLEPLGHTTFGESFRATAVGFAASAVLPARAGEVIRPYFIARLASRNPRMTTAGAFATIVLERILDVVTVLALLGSYVLLFGRSAGAINPTAFAWLTWIGLTAAALAAVVLVALFVLSGDPARLGRAAERVARLVPVLSAFLVRLVENFAHGLAVVRRPSRLLVALLWSFPLWLSIAAGLWAVTKAFRITMPFTGSFVLVALLALGVAVPTPGAVGGFHAAYRYGTTTFFGAPDASAVGAGIVAHLFSVGPTLLLGLWFAGRAGLDIAQLSRINSRSGTL
ncbi:MAG TPA: lysylphosphatidylglycerol synthase transmembrane domain-containing protein [Vicinamibacterales bacterium]|nr:lysylphosphatidylglycerol synthase transmembrane domain-containing protein [Vicinamibacterales bacterium]